MSLNRFILICLLSATSYFSSCEQQPRLKIESGNPPKFFVYGKGIIDVIQIDGEKEISSKDRNSSWSHYWIIAPQREFRLEELAKLNPIIYGKVPADFRQVYPESGEPEPFIEGGTYGFQLMIRNAVGVNDLFVLHNGKIITEGE